MARSPSCHTTREKLRLGADSAARHTTQRKLTFAAVHAAPPAFKGRWRVASLQLPVILVGEPAPPVVGQVHHHPAGRGPAVPDVGPVAVLLGPVRLQEEDQERIRILLDGGDLLAFPEDGLIHAVLGTPAGLQLKVVNGVLERIGQRLGELRVVVPTVDKVSFSLGCFVGAKGQPRILAADRLSSAWASRLRQSRSHSVRPGTSRPGGAGKASTSTVQPPPAWEDSRARGNSPPWSRLSSSAAA